MPDPLVVTAELDPETQERFEAERRELFPAGRTAVGAHVTLFHALPGDLVDEVEAELGRSAEALGAAGPVPVEVGPPYSLGKGVAYRLVCPPLAEQHAAWQRRWRERLTRQDAQRLSLHVTVQNKVDPAEARATLARLAEEHRPTTATLVSLRLWRYVGGPWEPVARKRVADAGWSA